MFFLVVIAGSATLMGNILISIINLKNLKLLFVYYFLVLENTYIDKIKKYSVQLL